MKHPVDNYFHPYDSEHGEVVERFFIARSNGLVALSQKSEGANYAQQLVAGSSTRLAEQTLRNLPKNNMLSQFMGDHLAHIPGPSVVEKGMKSVQFEQMPEPPWGGHLEPSKISNHGVRDFAPPVKRPYDQRIGDHPGTLVSGKQLEHALAGLLSPDIKLPKAQVLQTYPIIEDLSDESRSMSFQVLP